MIEFCECEHQTTILKDDWEVCANCGRPKRDMWAELVRLIERMDRSGIEPMEKMRRVSSYLEKLHVE